MTPPTITPLLVAELLVEGERWQVYVHITDHPAARLLVDTGMMELHSEVADLEPPRVPLSEQALRPRRRRRRRQHAPAAANSSSPDGRCTFSGRSSRTR